MRVSPLRGNRDFLAPPSGAGPTTWQLVDARFFDGHSGGGPRDIMMIYGMDGGLLDEPTMLVARTEDGFTKLRLYRPVQPGSAFRG